MSGFVPLLQAGNGVFALRDFKKGEVLTTYPTDYLCLMLGECGNMWIARDPEETLTGEKMSLVAPYTIRIGDTPVQIAGSPDVHHPHRCGHIINDGGFIAKKDFNQEDVNKYFHQSLKACNCTFVPLGGIVVVAVASRDIKTGEELFAQYGIRMQRLPCAPLTPAQLVLFA